MSGCGSSSREAFCDLGSARRCHLGRFPGYSSHFEGGVLRLFARFARCSFCGVCGEVCRLGGRLVEALFQRGCRAACVVSISPAHKCCSADDCRNPGPGSTSIGIPAAVSALPAATCAMPFAFFANVASPSIGRTSGITTWLSVGVASAVAFSGISAPSLGFALRVAARRVRSFI